MKGVVAAFNQEKALVGAFSVITNLRMDLFEALVDIVRAGPLRDAQLAAGRLRDAADGGEPRHAGGVAVGGPAAVHTLPRQTRGQAAAVRPGEDGGGRGITAHPQRGPQVSCQLQILYEAREFMCFS